MCFAHARLWVQSKRKRGGGSQTIDMAKNHYAVMPRAGPSFRIISAWDQSPEIKINIEQDHFVGYFNKKPNGYDMHSCVVCVSVCLCVCVSVCITYTLTSKAFKLSGSQGVCQATVAVEEQGALSSWASRCPHRGLSDTSHSLSMKLTATSSNNYSSSTFLEAVMLNQSIRCAIGRSSGCQLT
jgi:hypothetical protein